MSGSNLSIFPLTGALLYPNLHLPLHIFEPRYRAMIGDALAGDRRIGMIQPHDSDVGSPLYEVGCVGVISDVQTSEAGHYDIVLTGESRFRVLRELDVTTPFRQVEAALIEEPADELLSLAERAAFEHEARKFADVQGYSIDWDSVSDLDDVSLINGVSQIAPFDSAAKQALLEAADLNTRCELLMQLLEFFGHSDPDEGHVTLQ